MRSMCGVESPVSVSKPSRRSPSLKTNCAGSRASCGTGYGWTSQVADRKRRMAVDQAHARHHRTGWPNATERAVGEIHRQIVTASEARHAACVIVMLVRDEDGGEIGGLEPQAPEPHHRFARLKPQSTRIRVVPDSTMSPLPSLPLPSEAKRITSLQLLVKQRQDPVRGRRLLPHALLVEDVDLGALAHVFHVHPILLLSSACRCCSRIEAARASRLFSALLLSISGSM